MKYRLRLFAATFVFLVVFSALLVPRSASAQRLNRSNFRPDDRADIHRYRLSDGDVIMMTVEDDKGIAADQVEIVLKTDPNVTWWKSITVTQRSKRPDDKWPEFRVVNSISTQDDDHGPKAMRVSVADETNTQFQLIFAKAKVLGVHTDMYWILGNLDRFFNGLNGKRVIFTWQKD